MILVLLTLITSSSALGGYATILLYHRFGDPRHPTTSVSMEDFERQMAYLKRERYNVIPLSELVEILKRGEKVPEKTVVIAIDDGYKSTMKAYRVLKKYGFPFVVFLYMEAINSYPDFLTLKDIREMESSGLAEFENHSFSHRPFGLMKDTEAFIKDLDKSEEKFKRIFHRRPKYYALPFGYYNRKVLDVLKERGYEAVFAQDPGNVGSEVDLFRVPRQAIVGSWSKMKNFKRKLRREPLPLKRIVPKWGFIEENPPNRIGAVLKNPLRYDSCRIYITELGWKSVRNIKGEVYRENLPKLKRRWNRVGVKCRNKATGMWAESFWMIIRGDL